MFYADYTVAKPHISRTLLVHWHDHYSEYANGVEARRVPWSAIPWC